MLRWGVSEGESLVNQQKPRRKQVVVYVFVQRKVEEVDKDGGGGACGEIVDAAAH